MNVTWIKIQRTFVWHLAGNYCRQATGVVADTLSLPHPDNPPGLVCLECWRTNNLKGAVNERS